LSWYPYWMPTFEKLVGRSSYLKIVDNCKLGRIPFLYSWLLTTVWQVHQSVVE
jgi:hypothetical protein